MAISVVKTVYVSNGSGTASNVQAPSQTYGGGHALAVFGEYGNASSQSVTMSDGNNAYSLAFSQINVGSDRWFGYYALGITGFTGIIQAAFGAASQFGSLIIVELAGVDAAVGFIVGASLQQNTPGALANSLSVSANLGVTALNGMVVSVWANDSAPAPPSIGTLLTQVDQGTYWSFTGESGTGSHGAPSTDSTRCESALYTGLSGTQATTASPGAAGISDAYANLSMWFKEAGGSNTGVTPSVGAISLTGNAPNVTPAANTVIAPFTARRGGILLPKGVERDGPRIFLPSWRRKAA